MGPSWGLSWAPLGALLVPPWGPLGAFLEPFWCSKWALGGVTFTGAESDTSMGPLSLVALPVAGPLCSASLVERILSDAWSNVASSVEMLVKRFGCNAAMRI